MAFQGWDARMGSTRDSIARLIVRLIGTGSRASGAWLTAMVLVMAAAHADAAEIEPRSYVNTPVGMNFLLLGYAYADGGLATPNASPLKDTEITTHSGVLAYARSLDVWGKSGKVDVIMAHSLLDGHATVGGEIRERYVSGLNDPRVRFSVNFYGAPAMSVQEFSNWQQDLLIGASVQVGVPLGQYDRKRLVNNGNNRWTIKPDLGISKAWGPFVLELTGGITFYTDNEDFFGDRRLEQDPLYSWQVHATYNFRNHIWLAVSGNYDVGGQTTVQGVENDDEAENSRVGTTLALPVNRYNSLKLHASTSVETSAGRDFDLYLIVWQFRWGEGL